MEGARILSFLFLTFWVNGPKRDISSPKGQFLLQSHKSLRIDSYHLHSSIGVRVILVGYPVLALMWLTVFLENPDSGSSYLEIDIRHYGTRVKNGGSTFNI